MKRAVTVGMAGTAASMAGCSTVVPDEFFAQPFIVRQPRLEDSGLFQLLTEGDGDTVEVCAEWRGLVVDMDVDLGVATRRASAVSWAVATTSTPDLAPGQPPFSLGEIITISTPKIRVPGLGEQNPLVDVTPAIAFETMASGGRGARPANSGAQDIVRFDGRPTGGELLETAYPGRITGAQLVNRHRSTNEVLLAELEVETISEELVEDPAEGILVAGRKFERPDSYVFLLGWAPLDDDEFVDAVRSLARIEPTDEASPRFVIEGLEADVIPLDCGTEHGCSVALNEWVASLTQG